MRAIGRVIALLDTWEDPVYVTRVWCVYEQYVATSLKIPVEMILPPEAARGFHDALQNTGIKVVADSLTNVDVENAKASHPEDEKKVKALIRSGIGYNAVNTEVRNSMINWVQVQFILYVTSLRGSVS